MSGPASPRAVLWDMDGTLIDSAEYHWLTWRDALAAQGKLYEALELYRTALNYF